MDFLRNFLFRRRILAVKVGFESGSFKKQRILVNFTVEDSIHLSF